MLGVAASEWEWFLLTPRTRDKRRSEVCREPCREEQSTLLALPHRCFGADSGRSRER